MKISSIVNLDCNVEANKEVLYSYLLKLPFFKNKTVEYITADRLESALDKICSKYPVCLGYIMKHNRETADLPHYSFMLKTSNEHVHIITIYSLTLYEGLAKIVLYLFAYTRNKEAK